MSATADDQRETTDLLRGLGARLDRIETRLGSMEGRMDWTDIRFEKLDVKVEWIGNDMAELKGRISQLPSTIQLLGFVLAVLAISGAVRVFTP